jgi:hypothetical protein
VNDDHRTLSMHDALLTNRSEEQSLKSAETSRSHDEEVCTGAGLDERGDR